MADSTIESDRGKIPLDAEDNIIEVWLVDINQQFLELYLSPTLTDCEQVQTFQGGQGLSIQQFAGINIQVDEILG